MKKIDAANDSNDDIPVLTEVIEEPAFTLPTLTEVVNENLAPSVNINSIGEEELSATIQQCLEVHLETVFADRLATLQRQATTQALSELTAELPKLIQEALSAPLLNKP